MTMEEIVHGESKNVEFKEMLPKNSENYIKTIIAFANTQEGQPSDYFIFKNTMHCI